MYRTDDFEGIRKSKEFRAKRLGQTASAEHLQSKAMINRNPQTETLNHKSCHAIEH